METGSVAPSRAEESFKQMQITLLSARRMQLDESWQWNLISPFWRLYVHNRSGAFIQHHGKKLKLEPGIVYLIPAWLHFHTRAQTPIIQDFIHFDIAGMSPTRHRSIFKHIYTFPLETELKQLYGFWIAELTRSEDDHWSPLAKASSLLHSALAEVFRQIPSRAALSPMRTTHPEFEPALDLIYEKLSRPPQNKELARSCQMSTDHFIRKFKEAFHLTPAQYVLERRLAEAARQLTQSHLDIEIVAEMTGFSDRFHLSKAFKKQFGLNPAAYRRRHLTNASA